MNGAPVSEAQEENPGEQPSTKGSVRITVTISMSNGVFVKRKNSLFFGNHAKAEMSALYLTFIATCQMMGLSVLKYFKNLFAAIAAGRTDYENMLPMTLGVCKAA